MPYRPDSLRPQPIYDNWATADILLDIDAMPGQSRYECQIDLNGLLFNESGVQARFARFEVVLDSEHASSASLVVTPSAKAPLLPSQNDELSTAAFNRIGLVIENVTETNLDATDIKIRVSGEPPRALRKTGSEAYDAPDDFSSPPSSPFTFTTGDGDPLDSYCLELAGISGEAGSAPEQHPIIGEDVFTYTRPGEGRFSVAASDLFEWLPTHWQEVGLPFPPMTTAERDAIASPDAGATIFNTDTLSSQQYYDGAWHEMGGVLEREEHVFTTGDLAVDASEDLDAALPRTCLLLTVETDFAARVRGYITDAARTADSGRGEVVCDADGCINLPTPGDGVLFDVMTDAVTQVITMSPAADLYNDDDPTDGIIYLTVDRREGDGGTDEAITVTLTILKMEE